MSDPNASRPFTQLSAEEAEFIKNVLTQQQIAATSGEQGATYILRATSIAIKCDQIIKQAEAEKKLEEDRARIASEPQSETAENAPEASAANA